ncbi:MAG: hypothetical protein IJA72_03105 [Clostridia bacterium]|nr:hypothetical protein [Clostridia bacterium]
MEFITYTKNTDKSMLLQHDIFISPSAKICEGAKLYRGVKVYGDSYIGHDAELHSNIEICDSYISKGCKVFTGFIKECEIGENCLIKPFTHIINTEIGANSVIGNFTCINNSCIGAKAKISCLVNLNQLDAGNNITICSGVCCEADSDDSITLGDNVELGINTTIIKSVVISDNTKIKQNSIITKDILD